MRTFRHFFIASLALVLFGCGPSWKEHRSRGGPFFLKAPEGWSEQRELVNLGELQLSDSAHERYFTLVSEERKDLRNKTLERYSRFTRESVTGGLIHPETVGPKELKIGGLNALQYEITGKVEDRYFSYLHTIVEGREHFHQLIGWTPTDKKKENWPFLVKITDSFREKNP